MKRWEVLWLAFEKFAIFFSFAVTFILVMVLLMAGYVHLAATSHPGGHQGRLGM